MHFPLIRILSIALLTLLTVALIWASWPFIDRAAKSARPVPMPVLEPPLPASIVTSLTDFIEHQAVGTDALFGIALEKGLVDVAATLAELGIHEPDVPLTETERCMEWCADCSLRMA